MSDDVAAPPKWTQLEALERRVLGVLIEKAKTTPDVYPLTLKGLVTGSNQKSNRYPQMEVDEDRVADALEELRKVGAVAIIQGDGRVEKYRHLAYEWLGVDKVEMAVMAELLLRGAQTIGELRGRAARMEPIKGLDELGPILQSLQAKSLIVYLTPPGRGAVITSPPTAGPRTRCWVLSDTPARAWTSPSWVRTVNRRASTRSAKSSARVTS